MNVEKLKELYQNTSKHSNYQILPNCLQPFIDTNDLVINSRFEAERLDFLKSKVNFSGKKVVDIGGNTGYFTFQFLEEGAKEVDYIEGNKEHSEFVKFAANDLNLPINVHNTYLNFDETSEFPTDADIVLLFNVIHHLGDDFGDQSLSMEHAKIRMANSINYFHGKTETLILQMGFCWKGDRNLLLFENGTKQDMIDFVTNAIEGKWTIEAIGVAEMNNDKTVFNLLNEQNIKRNDAMGEFRNRPIFILKSI